MRRVLQSLDPKLSFRDFDPSRVGLITETQFRQALSMNGLELSDQEVRGGKFALLFLSELVVLECDSLMLVWARYASVLCVIPRRFAPQPIFTWVGTSLAHSSKYETSGAPHILSHTLF
jgi:hypothetical protein